MYILFKSFRILTVSFWLVSIQDLLQSQSQYIWTIIFNVFILLMIQHFSHFTKHFHLYDKIRFSRWVLIDLKVHRPKQNAVHYSFSHIGYIHISHLTTIKVTFWLSTTLVNTQSNIFTLWFGFYTAIFK